MRARFLLLGCLAISCAARAELPVLMPQPAQLQGAGTLLTIPKSLGVAVEGPSQLAQSAALQLLAQFQPQLQLRQVEAAQAQLQIRVLQAIHRPGPDDDESYQLEINKGRISLSAPSSTGMVYGLMTLNQLIRCDSSATANTSSCTVPAVSIQDQPRFRWRGLLLDSARRFIPLADIRRTLDGMAAAKLNVLHWHLTDDQGWRIESKAYPKLHQLASQGQFYTQA